MSEKNNRKEERKKERRRERRRLRRAKAKEKQVGAFAESFMQDEKPPSMKSVIVRSRGRIRKSSAAVQIGVLMPISDAGLEWIEQRDPELAVLIKEKNPRFRK